MNEDDFRLTAFFKCGEKASQTRGVAVSLRSPLVDLVDEARDLASKSKSENTKRSYAAAWRMFLRFRHDVGTAEIAPITPEDIGLWLAWMGGQGVKVSTIGTRLNGLLSLLRMRGTPLRRSHPAIWDVMMGLTRTRMQPTKGKAAFTPDQVKAMASACGRETKQALRNRAILLFGFASSLRRSEIAKLDCVRTPESVGWIELTQKGVLVTIRGKTGWRSVAVGRGGVESCPVKALEEWMLYAHVSTGPLFRSLRRGDRVTAERLSDRAIYEMIVAMAARIGLSARDFGAHSLRAGHATYSSASEADVQAQLGHAGSEMTRRYRRFRDPFAINMTKAVGL